MGYELNGSCYAEARQPGEADHDCECSLASRASPVGSRPKVDEEYSRMKLDELSSLRPIFQARRPHSFPSFKSHLHFSHVLGLA